MKKEVETIFDHNPTEEELDEFFASREALKEEPDSELLLDSFACRTREGYLNDMFEEIPVFTVDAARDTIKIHLSALFFGSVIHCMMLCFSGLAPLRFGCP